LPAATAITAINATTTDAAITSLAGSDRLVQWG
jgi:hypothetical protein